MNSKTFEQLCEEQFDRSKKILLGKNDEYSAGGDRLHNFKVAAELQGTTMMQALAGMMAKHTVSIFDLCRDGGSLKMWEEKITDHINYLLILNAMVREKSTEITPYG